ncbi:putative cell differentiation protein rcd1 [Trifolium pratense]|uniref:Putative cell differentiation protein rcd1 n=1 Tax=Trifolium pratense TaxID=57577 RepID=A0A2K3KT86_TRIPR|nr:putative cell differentiation protein rcd1 [Trifolium pratense]
MSNLPQSVSMNSAFGAEHHPPPSLAAASSQSSPSNIDHKMTSSEQLVFELSNPEL